MKILSKCELQLIQYLLPYKECLQACLACSVLVSLTLEWVW